MTLIALLLSLIIAIIIASGLLYYCFKWPMDEEEADHFYTSISDVFPSQLYYR